MTDEFERYCISAAEKFLNNVKGLVIRQASAHDALNQQLAIRDSLKAIDYSIEKAMGTSPDDRLINTIENIDRLIGEYEAVLDDWNIAVKHAKEILARMENQQYAAVLERYYIVGLTWRETAARSGYSVDNLYKIRPAAHIGFYMAMTNYETGIPEAIPE